MRKVRRNPLTHDPYKFGPLATRPNHMHVTFPTCGKGCGKSYRRVVPQVTAAIAAGGRR